MRLIHSWFALALTACTSPPPEGNVRSLVVVPPDCSTNNCTYADEPTTTAGYRAFTSRNFTAIVDGFGKTRQFIVHIPANYDSLPSDERMPLIFAFHGGDQTNLDMINGFWDAYFEQDYAFVFPLGEVDPCDSTGIRQWIQPGIGEANVRDPVYCDPATNVAPDTTFWKASLPGSFTDVKFVEQLRSMLLSRFPKLNPAKVYATGFSAGGGMTFALACYRASLFRGFSVVSKSLASPASRGDYLKTGITDPDSMTATCGRNLYDPAHATGIASPQLWGTGTVVPTTGPPIAVHTVKPVTVFWGDHDDHTPQNEREAAAADIRSRNNLSTAYTAIDPFQNTGADSASTERRTHKTAASTTFLPAAFRRFLVTADAMYPNQAGHAPPDVNRCTPGTIMTCDYNYTDQTIEFWEDLADLNTNP